MEDTFASTYFSLSELRVDLNIDLTSSYLEVEENSIWKSGYGQEYTLQLPIDALSLEISSLKLIVLQNAISELGLVY